MILLHLLPSYLQQLLWLPFMVVSCTLANGPFTPLPTTMPPRPVKGFHATPDNPFVSTAPDAGDGLYDPIELAFKDWLRATPHKTMKDGTQVKKTKKFAIDPKTYN